MTTISIPSEDTAARSQQKVGWILFFFAAALWVISIVIQFLLPTTLANTDYVTMKEHAELFVDGFGFLTFGLVGAVLLARGNRLGWAYLLPGLLYNISACVVLYGLYAYYVNQQPGASALLIWMNVLFLPTIAIVLVIIPLLYPTGRPWSKTGKVLFVAAVTVITLGAFGLILTPGPVNEPLLMDPNPFGIEKGAALLEGMMIAISVALVLLILAAAGTIIIRLRRADPFSKGIFKWFLAGELILVVVFLSDSFMQPLIPIWAELAPLIAIPAIPVATYFALLRNR